MKEDSEQTTTPPEAMQKADTLSQIAEQRSIKRMRYIGAVVGTVSGIFVWSFVGEDRRIFLKLSCRLSRRIFYSIGRNIIPRMVRSINDRSN